MVGAGAIAIAPVIATPPDVKIVNPAVHESASPLDTYVETVREALENLEALIGSALALPAPTGWTLELALDSLFNDPSGDVQLFVDDLESLGPLAGASLPALLENAAAAAVETAIGQAAEGDSDLAIVTLIRTYVTLVPAVVAVVGAPLKLLGPDVAAVGKRRARQVVEGRCRPRPQRDRQDRRCDPEHRRCAEQRGTRFRSASCAH